MRIFPYTIAKSSGLRRLLLELGWLGICAIIAYGFLLLWWGKADISRPIVYVNPSTDGSVWVNIQPSSKFLYFLVSAASAVYCLRGLFGGMKDRLVSIAAMILMAINVLALAGAVVMTTWLNHVGSFGEHALPRIDVIWAEVSLFVVLYAVWCARYWRHRRQNVSNEE